MAGLFVPVDANAAASSDVSGSLPDSTVVRFPKASIQWMHLTGIGIAVTAPVKGEVRTLALPSALGGTAAFVQLSPLPFGIAKEVRKLPGGMPTFYLAADGTATFKDGDLVEAKQALWTNAGNAYVGVLFQDGVSLTPRRWIELL